MEPAGPSTEKLISTAEPQEEKNDTQGPPTLTRNRSFKSKQLVRSQAIRESQSPPRLPSPLPPHNQSEPNASVVQSNSEPNLNVTAAVAEVKSVSSTPSLKGSDDSFNVINNASSKNNNPSSLNENKSDRNASQCRAESDAREGGGVRNKQRGRKGDRGGEGKQGREGKECQRVEIQITSGNWESGSPARNRSPKNRDNHDRHSRTQTQKRCLSTKQSSQDSGWRSLEEESWRKGCVCGACSQDKECLWNKWRICPDCRGRKNEPRCPTKQDSGVVCSDDCSDCSEEVTSPEIVLSSANSEPILATDRRRGKDSDKYPEDSYYTMCRCHERNDNLSNNNNSINSNKNTPALLKHLVQDDMDSKNNELAGPTLVQFIKDTLNKSIKDRISLLRIEKELVSLVHDTGRTQHKFPSMTSYGRMLVHRCAQLFCLQHKLNPMAKEAVIVTKIGTFGGRVPCTPFQKWCSVQFPDASVKLHQDMTQAKSILKRSAHSLDESVSAAARGSASARSKSFEQREEEYERVRRRIFSGDETRGSVADDFNWLQQSEEIVSSLGNTNNVYGKLLTPDTGGGRQNKLMKVHSLETRTGDSLASSGSPRAAVSKSHSFGGYGSSQTPQGARVLSRQGDLASSSWRLSPSSSGYKTLSLRSTDSVTPSPTGDATPEPESQLERAPLLWAVTVTDVSAVPPGAIIILPQTGMPLANADGSTYHYDPNRPPILPENAQADNAKTQPQHRDKKDEFPGEKRRGRLEKQNSITAPDNYERSPDTLPENTKMLKCCLECCQPNDGMKGGVATLSGQSNTNTLTKSIPNESDTTIDKAISNVCYQLINEPIAGSPTRNASKNGTYTKPHTNYIPYGENTKKNMVHERQNPELLSQKIDPDLAYYPLGFQDVSGYGETEFECYQGHNITGGTNVIQQSQDLAAYCSEADTQKMDLRQSHYNQDGATCQPLRIQLAGPESYAAQVAEHCRLEQNVVQAYALTHQQLVPVQQPAIVHYAQSTAPQHDKPIEGLQGQPNMVYGAYGTCGVPHYAMMDHPGALTDPGRSLLDHNAGLHPTPPPHHPYPVYHDPTLTAQRYAGLQHRQPALLHHAYQYPSSWTTQWPLIAANPNVANQSCPTPVPKPQTPPGVFVPQPDLSLAYQSNPGLIQYPGLLQYPPVNYGPLIQPHLIHTQPHVYPSVYPQQYIDTRTQIPTPTYGEQTNRNNNSGVRSYESFQSTNSRSFRSNVRSPRCNSRTGSVSGSSRTTPLEGQYTPPSNSGENFQQDERFVAYPVYRTHGNTNAYYCNPNCPATNQSGIDFQRNNESNTYLQHAKNYPKNPNEPNRPNVSSNENQSDVYSKRRAFRSNASRSQNSLSRQDSFDQGNAGNGNVRKDCILHVQEKISQMDIANDENISKVASQLTINDTKPFVSNLSPNSQNFVPKKYVKTAQTEPSTAQVYESNRMVLTKSHVYPVPAPANLVMERDMHSLRDVENSMRSSRQNQEFARSYVPSQSSGREYNTNDSAEKSNGSQKQQSKNEHSNVESLQCETTLAPNLYQKTNLVETDVNVTSNISMKVNYQHYAVQNNFTEETAVHSGSTKEYATKNAQGSSRYENGTHETQPDSQLSKAISNVNANNEELNTNEIVSSTENNMMQSERVILSQSTIYARPVDTSTGQGVLNVSNHEIELNSIYDRSFTSNNERNSADSITGLNYPGFNDNGGAERSFQPRSSANHGFARRDGGFRFRFNSRNPGFRAPSHGAVQQLHQQMQLQYGRPFMFARQMYTGGWSRRSPSPLSSTFQSVHQNGPRYSGPRPVRPPQYQDRYNARL